MHPLDKRLLMQTPVGALTIRPARPEDLDLVMGILSDACRWLHARGIQQWPDPIPPSEWQVMALTIAAGDVYLAFLPDGRAVGTFRFQWRDQELWGEDSSRAGYIHDFAIHDSVRGNGVGTAMLEWAKEHFRSQGKQFLRLDCVAHNPGLNRYYRKLGLTYRGQVDDGDGYVASLYETAL